MLRCTFVSRVHLFSALVPHANVIGTELTATEVSTALSALDERRTQFPTGDLRHAIEAMSTLESMQLRRAAVNAFSDCVDNLRAELNKKSLYDAQTRLQIHEAIMAAGFYQRTLGSTHLPSDGPRFALNHYNYDIRRDTEITKRVWETLLPTQESTPESDALLQDIFLMERHLSGPYRLAPVAGRRWLVLGEALSELKTEEDVQRVLSIPIIKAVGNFVTTKTDDDALWQRLSITTGPEKVESFLEMAGLHKNFTSADRTYGIRVEKPRPELTYWENMRERMLRVWVIVFSVWVMFWLVDEEIITLLALLFMKHQHTKVLEKEAERTGGKVYIARSTGGIGN